MRNGKSPASSMPMNRQRGTKQKEAWLFLKSQASILVLLILVICNACAPPARSSVNAQHCFTCTSETCQPTDIQSQMLTGGLFTQGNSDLTGDGIPEHIQLEGTHVTIVQDGVEVWRSPEAWDIVDVALGDPNDDGRNEVLIVFWREDENGQRINQPFLIGYRGGYYRELWGGSPVGYPIVEVELADVDGDSLQEIIVLEAVPDAPGQRTVAVWRWSQWWFTFGWRSDAGEYHNLQTVHQRNNKTTAICVTTSLPQSRNTTAR